MARRVTQSSRWSFGRGCSPLRFASAEEPLIIMACAPGWSRPSTGEKRAAATLKRWVVDGDCTCSGILGRCPCPLPCCHGYAQACGRHRPSLLSVDFSRGQGPSPHNAGWIALVHVITALGWIIVRVRWDHKAGVRANDWGRRCYRRVPWTIGARA